MQKDKNFSVCVMIVLLIVLGIAAVIVLPQRIQAYRQSRKLNGAKVILYEGPKSLRDATVEDLENTSEKGRNIALLHCTDTRITINGEECYVYDTCVNHTRQWVSNYLPPLSRTPIAYFDFEGAALITLTVPDRDLTEVTISPLSYEITPKVDPRDHTVTFLIDTPDAYTV